MSFDSPSDNIEKEFPGLYGGDSAAGIDDDHDKQTKKKEKREKKDKQKDKKDKGYTMFAEDDDAISVSEDVRSPGKVKKSKQPFKFQKKDIFPKSKDKDMKKEGKEKRKEDKELKKEKSKFKDKKKSKHSMAAAAHMAAVADKPVFGVPLAQAVERNKCHDGIELPALVRECIDYIEEHGLSCEGIYRISGVKSKVQHLKDCYNSGLPAYLYEHEPNVVASLLKQYLRELPEPVLTSELMAKFEESATIRSEDKKVEAFSHLLDQLPSPNRLLLSWMIVHMSHIIHCHRDNKMSLQNVSIVLSPTMQISHRVLNILFSHTSHLFKDTVIKRYVPPLKPASSKWSLELPDTPAALEEELAKQESLLSQLHEEMKSGEEDALKYEQLWEVQRIVTQLKRKIKFARKALEAVEKRKKEKSATKGPITQVEVLDLQLQVVPEEKTGVTTAVVEKRNSGAERPEESAEKRNSAAEKRQSGAERPEGIAEKRIDEEKMKNAEEIGVVVISAGEDNNEGGAEVEVCEREVCRTEEESREGETAEHKQEGEDVVQKEDGLKGSDDDTDENVVTEEKVVGENVAEYKEERCVFEEKNDRVDVTVETGYGGGSSSDDEVDNRAETDVKIEYEQQVDEAVEGDLGQAEASEEEVGLAETSEEEVGQAGESEEEVGQAGESEEEVAHAEESKEEVGLAEASEGEVGLAETSKEEVGLAEASEGDDSDDYDVAIDFSQDVGSVSDGGNVYSDLPVDLSTPKRGRHETDDVRPALYVQSGFSQELLTPIKVTKHGDIVEAEAVEPLNLTKDAVVKTTERGSDEIMSEELKDLEYTLILEEEELRAIGDELRKKLETEYREIERLRQEIAEIQYMRQDSDCDDYNSSTSDTSNESEDEEELQDMVTQLIAENEALEKKNAELCQKIHDERMICLGVKVQIRLIQQKQLESDNILDRDNPF